MTRTTRISPRVRSRAAITVLLTLVLLPLLPASIVQAQVAINTTTLSAALPADTTSGTATIALTSGATVAVGQVVYVDREAMRVTATTPTATHFIVQRGAEGTTRAAHALGAVVYTGPPQHFAASTALQEVAGACVAGAEIATPKIYLQSGNVYGCHSGAWQVYRRGGFPDSPAAATGATYTTNGALAVQPGVSTLASATHVMTLVSPTLAQEGMVMTITSLNASAHLVTYTPGFSGGGTARDVATFAVTLGASFTIRAVGGVWHITSASGVTFG